MILTSHGGGAVDGDNDPATVNNGISPAGITISCFSD